MTQALSRIRAAAARMSWKDKTSEQRIARNTTGGNELLLQYGSGHYAAMGRKSAKLRKTKTA